VLRDAGLVDTERVRYWTYYRLRPEAIGEIGQAITVLGRTAPVAGERRRPCC
jgi:DNA-binding transcriptional ArsR family regulator